MPDVTLWVVEENRGVTTDEKGFFRLEAVTASATIDIEYIGYATQSITASTIAISPCKDILLALQTNTLEKVIIKEYITTGIDRNSSGSITISNEKLGILPGQIEPDIFQSMQLIPGINSPDETVTGLQVRGGSPDQNLILWDAIKLYNNGHFFGSFSAINPHIIKDAVIFKGGASAQYGDRISGVIDISSDREVPDRFSGGVGINGTTVDAFVKVPVSKKTGVILSGRRSYTDVITTDAYTQYAEKAFQNSSLVALPVSVNTSEISSQDDFRFYDMTAKLIFDIADRHKVMVSGLFTNNQLLYTYADDTYLGIDDIKTRNIGASISWKYRIKDQLQHHLKMHYSNYDLDYDYSDEVGPQASFYELIPEEDKDDFKLQFTKKNTVKDIGLESKISYEMNASNRLIIRIPRGSASGVA